MKNNSAIFFVVVDEFIQWALQKRWRNTKLKTLHVIEMKIYIPKPDKI